MTGGCGTFSFVERVTAFDPRVRAGGCFTIPANVTAWSPCLLAEAVGQLAAWVAMENAHFLRRPVAALACAARIDGDVAPGDCVELGVELDDCDADVVAYDGWANVGERRVLELKRCVGVMLPMEEFDDPKAVRARFDLLRREGLPWRGEATAIIVDTPAVVEHEPGKSLRATLQIPEAAAFFADHFPRKPVFPATLLLDAQIRLAVMLASEVAVGLGRAQRHENHPFAPPYQGEVLEGALGECGSMPLRAVCVRDVKVRSFLTPGQTVEITSEVVSAGGATAEVAMIAKAGGKRVCTARLEAGSREGS